MVSQAGVPSAAAPLPACACAWAQPHTTSTPQGHPGAMTPQRHSTHSAKGSRVYFLPFFPAPIVTILSNNIPVLFFIEPCLTFWKTCHTWVVLSANPCLTGTRIWDERGCWGLWEAAQPCPGTRGAPMAPACRHSSCSGNSSSPGDTGLSLCPQGWRTKHPQCHSSGSHREKGSGSTTVLGQ